MTTIREAGPRAGTHSTAGARAALCAGLAINLAIGNLLVLTAAPAPNALLTLANLAGVNAALLTMLQLVLVARLPWLDRRIGMDRLTHWHRWSGFGLLWAVITHAVLVVEGFATLGGTAAWQTFGALAGVPASLLGILAGTLITAVAVTSLRRVRRRLPYEVWHGLHLLLYAALLLGLMHQALETTTMTTPGARAYWWTMWIAVGGSLLAGRVVLPLWRNAYHRFRVAAVVPESGEAVSVYVTGRRLDRYPARAGQFAVWRFPDHQQWWTANPFSFSLAPNGRYLRLTARAVGATSAGLRNLSTGSRVFVEGPYGAFTAAAKVRRDTLLVAGGIGITPILALLEELEGSVVLLYRVRSAGEASLLDEVGSVARSRGAVLHVLAGPSVPRFSAVTLGSLVPDIAGRDVFVCGPPAMTSAVVRALRDLAVPRSQVHWERFGLG
ncbi:ferric reductase-like transmembrane domain-containing protein [Micromonospora sp. NPDC051141]|uniref:ferredoxin reductase family protein n=1 Tax=Micromonospora sp. NPDC051141 TaxID=3364284 RepID=UPI00379E3046